MIKACVISMGPIGNTHVEVYQSLPGTRLIGVCDRHINWTRAAGEKCGVAWYEDTEVMLDVLKPDIVSVATGGFECSSDHYEPTVQALHARTDVLCEKPICNDPTKAEEMVRTADTLNHRFALDLNHRFPPAARVAKGWQQEESIGELLFINMNLWIGHFEQFHVRT